MACTANCTEPKTCRTISGRIRFLCSNIVLAPLLIQTSSLCLTLTWPLLPFTPQPGDGKLGKEGGHLYYVRQGSLEHWFGRSSNSKHEPAYIIRLLYCFQRKILKQPITRANIAQRDISMTGDKNLPTSGADLQCCPTPSVCLI